MEVEAGMKLSEMMVSILIVSGIVGGFTLFLGDVGMNYGKTDVVELGISDQTSAINEKSEALTQKLKSAQGFNLETMFDIMNFMFFSVSSILFNIPAIFGNMIQGVTGGPVGDFIPLWMVTMITAIVAIVIAMKVLSIIAKRDV